MEDPEFCRAVEAELIKVGLRLRWLCDGTDRLNWRDVQVVILEADQSSAIARCELGESAFWTVDTHLLAGVLDALNGANFQRSGGRGKRPSPTPRPGMEPRGNSEDSKQAVESGNQIFSGDGFEMDAVSLDELNEWLGLSPALP